MLYHWLTNDKDVHRHPHFLKACDLIFYSGLFQTFMLSSLWLLNCYWAILIMRIAWDLIFKGSWANELHGESVEANDVNLIKKKIMEEQQKSVNGKTKAK